MTQHDHRSVVPGCFRCDLSSAEPHAEQSGPTAAGTAQGERVDLTALERLAADHRRKAARPVCRECAAPWPCDTSQALAELAALRGQLAEAQRFAADAWHEAKWSISHFEAEPQQVEAGVAVYALKQVAQRVYAALAALDPSGQRGGAGL